MKKKINYTGPFDLRSQNNFFGGWPVLEDTPEKFSIVICFPVEGWQESAAVIVTQMRDGVLYAATDGSGKAVDQAIACLSLDIDATHWLSVGDGDTVIGSLQRKYNFLRPVLFHSPYEAAAGFIIGQRISIKQRQAIQKKLSEQHGEKFIIDEKEYFAFPTPQKLLEIQEFSSVNSNKIERLHGVAQAALDGLLDRKSLLSLSTNEALMRLESLNGIGLFYASGILFRGAGVVDGVSDDSLTKYAIQQAYKLQKEPTHPEVIKIAEKWKPFRMWCTVLIHIWLRREVGLPKRR